MERAPDCARNEVVDEGSNGDTVLYSISPFPLLFVAALPGGEGIRFPALGSRSPFPSFSSPFLEMMLS